jgi:hypothetical protein
MGRIAFWLIFACLCYFMVVTFGIPHIIEAR